jgi:hypothetical protein
MKKLIQIKISGNGTGAQQYFAGEDADKDFFEAIQKAAQTLAEQKLHYAEVLLFENEDATYDQAIRKFEIMRHV